jgi:Ca2+-binding EF-hand superfamily protein
MKGDGKIAASQLGDTLRSLGQNPTESEIRKCGYANNPGKHAICCTYFVLLTKKAAQNF